MSEHRETIYEGKSNKSFADAAAKAFLSSNQATFINDHGESQKLFTATDQQVFRLGKAKDFCTD